MRRNNSTLTIAGETHTLAAWSKISGVPYNTIRHRLQRGIRASEAVFGERYSTHRLEGGQTEHRKRRKGQSYPVGPLTQWGGVQSITFRGAA